MTRTIRLLLVDDHPVLRAGLANLLARHPDFTVVGEAGSGGQAIELARTCRADVCLLDLNLPDIDGFDTLKALRTRFPAVRVVVLTSSDSPEDAARADREGAVAFVCKNIDHGLIVDTIRAVYRGESGIQRGVARSQRSPALAAALTPRELDVLSLVRQGLGNSEIARRLAISERTVKGHMTSILEKLHVADRAGAVAKGFDLGLLRVSR
jgi:DNA-binding NarL/FixJ family response regulator